MVGTAGEMTEVNMCYDWKLAFVLPNLNLRDSIESDSFALVSPNDERLLRIKQECKPSNILLTKFLNQFGRSVTPCAIIFKGSQPTIDRITNFRNVVAISAIIKGWGWSIFRGQCLEAIFSDYFDLYPITPANDGQHLIIHTPAQLGYDEADNFSGQISPLIVYPVNNAAVLDEELLNLLLRFFKKNPKQKSWKARAIFRSLEMAYQASAIIYDNPFSESDVGSRIGLWVSAFETITHPGRGSQVGVNDVIGLLGAYNFSDRKLKQELYKYRGNKVNFVQKIYGQLYDSRNAFFHGNPIRNVHRRPLNRNKGSFLTIVPMLYRIALMIQLGKIGIIRPQRGLSRRFLNIADDMDFEKVLLKYLEYLYS